jgi:hypothetical protein
MRTVAEALAIGAEVHSLGQIKLLASLQLGLHSPPKEVPVRQSGDDKSM